MPEEQSAVERGDQGSAWIDSNGTLVRVLRFADFNAAFAALTRLALLAEARQHHPDLSISWNKVTVSLTTHDAANQVTERDRQFAALVDEWWPTEVAS